MDDLRHYVVCTKLHRILQIALPTQRGFHLQVPARAGRDARVVGLCILGVDPFRVDLAALASLLYHRAAAKVSFEEGLLLSQAAWKVWLLRESSLGSHC